MATARAAEGKAAAVGRDLRALAALAKDAVGGVAAAATARAMATAGMARAMAVALARDRLAVSRGAAALWAAAMVG